MTRRSGALLVAAALVVLLPAPSAGAGPWRQLAVQPDAAAQRTTWGKYLHALHPFNGTIYAGYGDWEANSGPILMRPFDLASGTFTAKYEASLNTEAVMRFRTIGGALYVPHADQRGGDGGFSRATVAGGVVRWAQSSNPPLTHALDVATFSGTDLVVVGTRGKVNQVFRCEGGDCTTGAWSLSYGDSGPRYLAPEAAKVSGQLYTSLGRRFAGTSWTPHALRTGEPFGEESMASAQIDPADAGFSLVIARVSDGTNWWATLTSEDARKVWRSPQDGAVYFTLEPDGSRPSIWRIETFETVGSAAALVNACTSDPTDQRRRTCYRTTGNASGEVAKLTAYRVTDAFPNDKLSSFCVLDGKVYAGTRDSRIWSFDA